jgi:hypothetical protein
MDSIKKLAGVSIPSTVMPSTGIMQVVGVSIATTVMPSTGIKAGEGLAAADHPAMRPSS